MLNQRQRLAVWAIVAMAAIWLLAGASYYFAQHLKVTPDTVRSYAESVDLNRLTPAERALALQKLAAMLNALTLEERRQAHLDRLPRRWFETMTEAEKEKFLETTMPTGIKQMLNAFEALPPDKQQHLVADAVKKMKAAQDNLAAGGSPPEADGMALSPQLQEKMMKVGLQNFYSQSSAQTKAELAPLLEQIQRLMQNGRMLRGQ